MIDLVAIDGPVGVGKSSVAGQLARRLGWRHLDTGAMYRAVALLALKGGAPLADAAACAGLAQAMQFDFAAAEGGQRVIVNGADATDAIRSAEVTAAVSSVADAPAVREVLAARQRALGEAGRAVAEGRDMSTVVFPDARWKIYLDADPAERARRRGAELEAKGRAVDPAQLRADVAERDRRDRTRPVGALKVARDAIIVDTTFMDLARVVSTLEQIVRGDLDSPQ